MPNLNKILQIPKFIADYDWLESSFPPPIIKPRMRGLIDKKCVQFNPALVEGMTIEPGVEYKIPFKQEYWRYIATKYKIRMVRLCSSWEQSSCMALICLGDGYFLSASGADPWNANRIDKHTLFLSFLYSEGQGSGGIYKLAQFIKFVASMPQCPFEVCYFTPFGAELLNVHSRHLDLLGYTKQPTHTTKRLERAYRRLLKAKATNFIDDTEHRVWRADLFEPIDPIIRSDPFPWPKLMENYTDPTLLGVDREG